MVTVLDTYYRYGQLIGPHDRAPDPLGQTLGLIERYYGRDNTNSKSGKEASSNEHWLGFRDRLQDNAEVEDEPRCDEETPTTAQDIGERCGKESSDEFASRQNGHDERDLGRSDFSTVVCKSFLPEVHGEDATNRTGVISEVIL